MESLFYKKNLVIVAGNVYPVPSATGSLALKCAEFLKDDYNIKIIAIQQGRNAAFGLKCKNFTLYTFSHWRLLWAQQSFEGMRNSTGWKNLLYRTSYLLARVMGRAQSTFLFLDNMYWYKNKILSALESFKTIDGVDVLLTLNAPIESHLAALSFSKKYSSVRWISFWSDLFAVKENKINIFVSIKKMLELENRLIDSADVVLATEEIYEVFNLRITDHLALAKITSVPYFMKDKILNQEHIPSGNRISNFIYMGSFYREIRNPEYMLQVFDVLEAPFKLDLYVTNQCDDIVQRYVRKSNGRITNHGTVTLEVLNQEMRKATVLINIENTIQTSRPSKLFELISYRKPILNFHHHDNYSGFLEKYPNVCQILIGSPIAKSVEKITKFLDNQIATEISKEYLESCYEKNTEETVKELIRGLVD